MSNSDKERKASELELGSRELLDYLNAKERSLLFPSFDAVVAHELGEFMRARFIESRDPEEAIYIQIRSYPARPGAPFVLYAAVAGNSRRLGAGIAYQVEGKSRVLEHSGGSTFQAKAFTAFMGWPVEKMGLNTTDYIVNGGGFPIKLINSPTPVGGILVSGLPDVEDHQFIIDALEEFLPRLSGQ